MSTPAASGTRPPARLARSLCRSDVAGSGPGGPGGPGARPPGCPPGAAAPGLCPAPDGGPAPRRRGRRTPHSSRLRSARRSAGRRSAPPSPPSRSPAALTPDERSGNAKQNSMRHADCVHWLRYTHSPSREQVSQHPSPSVRSGRIRPRQPASRCSQWRAAASAARILRIGSSRRCCPWPCESPRWWPVGVVPPPLRPSRREGGGDRLMHHNNLVATTGRATGWIQSNQGVALAGGGRSDQGQVLGGVDPLPRREVGPGRGADAAGCEVEAFNCSVVGKFACLPAAWCCWRPGRRSRSRSAPAAAPLGSSVRFWRSRATRG